MKYPKQFTQPLELGEVTDDWIDDVHRRMFLYVEKQLAALERAESHKPDPIKEIRKELDFLEELVQLRASTRQSQPSLRARRRARPKPRGRQPR